MTIPEHVYGSQYRAIIKRRGRKDRAQNTCTAAWEPYWPAELYEREEKVDLDDMNASLGERYARGEFETRVIDGERVERQIRLRMYGFLFVEYRYPDGKPSQWGVRFPHWPNEMLMSTNQANVLRHALDDYLDQGSPSGAITRQRITTGERMNPGLDEVFPPTPEVWAELAQYLTAGDHQLGKAVRFLEEEEGGTNPKLLAERLGVKGDYAAWLLTHARKMKGGSSASWLVRRTTVGRRRVSRLTTTGMCWTPTSPLKPGTMWKR